VEASRAEAPVSLPALVPVLLAACAPGRPGGLGGPTLGADAGPSSTVRVATWNVQSLGEPGSDELAATELVLARLDADLVVLQEVDEEEGEVLDALADSLGYPTVARPDRVPFGTLGCAALARLDAEVRFPGAAELSGDPDADDLTRQPAVVSATLPRVGLVLALAGTHLKSGAEPVDAFRRAVDALRTAQAAAATDADVVLVAGDLNDDVDDVDPYAPPWRTPPPELPSTYELGRDVVARLAADGLPRDPFALFEELGLEVLGARQPDGTLATRPQSGRRLDYVLGSAAVGAWRGEVVDPADGSTPGLADADKPLPADAATRASDHLPVLGELSVAAR
jgi:exonuclease III